MMHCHNCGAAVPDDAVACDSCGAALIRPSRTGAAAPTPGAPTAAPSTAAPRASWDAQVPQSRLGAPLVHQRGNQQHPQRVPQAPLTGPYHASPSKNKVAAGLLAIFLGSLGAHKFYLGYNGAGTIMLLVTLFSVGLGAPAMGLIGLVEGVLYLTKSDAAFWEDYVYGERAWF